MIPIMNVSLPNADQLYPFLQQIDSSKTYSNFGPLYQQLIKEVSEFLDVDAESVVGVSSATSGLQLALLEIADRYRTTTSKLVVAVPNWTFSATPQAALSLGCNVVLFDTDKDGVISLDDVVSNQINGEKVDVVILVRPFGAEIQEKKWEEASSVHKFSVIVDAAACFFNYSCRSSFVNVISTHATKGFSTGEGGLVICPNTDMANRIVSMSNFGFSGSRESKTIGQNSKLSEFSSAVGLAMIQSIAQHKERLISQVLWYENFFKVSELIVPLIKPFPRTTYSIYFKAFSKSQVDDLVLKLYLERGIEVRRWWNKPISSQPIGEYCRVLSSSLQKSIHLSDTVIGIPLGLHLTKSDQDFIAKSILEDISHA